MRSLPVHLGRGLGLLLGVVVTATAQGQPIVVAHSARAKAPAAKDTADRTPPGSVHRIVVFEGANRSVHYVTSGALSTADRLAAFDLERAENELTYIHDLQRLKQQYVNSERIMEPQRRYVQEQLYGTQIRYGGSNTSYGGYGGYGYGGNGYGGYGYGGYGSSGIYSPYAFGGLGYRRSPSGSVGSTSYSVVRSLQFGMGDEGRLKNAMVSVLAREASSDYADAALRRYDTAAGRAASSATLSRDLSLRKGPAAYADREPSFAKGDKITIWLGNDKYTGTVKEDRPGWLVLQTDKGEVTVRKSEITRSETPSKPAGGPGR